MANKALAKKIYSKQNEIVREINNAHIFLEQVVPLLADARNVYAKSNVKIDKNIMFRPQKHINTQREPMKSFRIYIKIIWREACLKFSWLI